MLRLLADEHVPSALVRGLASRQPDLDIVRVQDVGLRTRDDETLLDWGARNGRVLLSEDRRTLAGFANGRIAGGRPFAGLILYDLATSTDRLIEDILIVANACSPDDLATQIFYVPL
jgi:predicted nuclease of predicted toxin-antitoxin system